ncbi:MAG: hypothetical protein EOP34_10540 [Rickettsiales bacterium]|nr:MAG: hypothetical protein EOP34_10540 [Rickettsiales bacterium]
MQNNNATRININFMARGEPLANKYVIKNYAQIYDLFNATTKCTNLKPKVNISTIMPQSFIGHNLFDIFKGNAHIYYSLYTANSKIRENFMPNACNIKTALDNLKDYENKSIALGIKYPITFHWAIIEGVNDKIEDVLYTADVLAEYKFKSKFNLVRYNPHELSNTSEPSEDKLKQIFNIISKAVGVEDSYIVPRVGKDVSASCGMFIK